MNFIQQAKQNRRDFLEPYRVQVQELSATLSDLNKMDKGLDRAKAIRKTKGEIKSVVTYLLEIEPSHIRENWILDVIDDRKADGEKVTLPKERGLREPVKGSEARLGILFFEIRRFNARMKERYASRSKWQTTLEHAIVEVWKQWDDRNPDAGISYEYLRRKFFEYSEGDLPWPYWLRDIVEEEEGGTYEIRGRGLIEIE
jgi:hypothetical protein